MRRVAAGDMREQGAALVVVLWICAVVALLAGGFTLSVTLEARRLSAQVRGAEARALVEAGLAHAVMGLRQPNAQRRWVPDGREYRVAEEGASLSVRVWDEGGRLDLNRAPPPVLEAVLGMEVAAWTAARRTAGRPAASIAELAGAGGPGAAAYRDAAPLATVHGAADGTVSALAAPPALLRAWPGLTAADAAALLEARRAGQAPGRELAGRAQAAGLAVDRPPGPAFTVRVEVAGGQGARASAEAVLWIAVDAASAYRILEWREPAPDLHLPGTDAGMNQQ